MDEAAPPEPSAEPAPAADRGSFAWPLTSWSTRCQEESIRSDIFVVAGRKWRLLLYPRGSAGAPPGFVSLFLDSTAEERHFPLDKVDFTLVLHGNGTPDVTKTSSHHFTTSSPDWGFNMFVKHAELSYQDCGFLVNDTLSFSVDLQVLRHVDWSVYDSKKATGFVGLKNQGATCYLNSLLQTLFHLTAFRKAIYELPTSSADAHNASIALALQSLFYKLQVGQSAASTSRLTQSFGWGAADSFLQHDVQELSRVLCDKLEENMKGTSVEGTMQALFEGHTTTYIECLDVPYVSSRKESFLDLQLDVRGCCDVLSSFERFVEAEQLDGDNAYAAEGHGLQRARKGVRFAHLPPVLQLQLKRFEYDSVQDGMQKLNDRYEFPLELDLSGFVHAPSGNPPPDGLYALHSVLVHSGGASGGHYYAYVRPTCAGADWFCFDDDRVTRVGASCAIEDNFGGGGFFPRADSLPPGAPGGLLRGGHSSAYMLVYVRIQDIPRVLCPHSEADIPDHVRLRIEAEAAEKARVAREQDEAHMYVVVRVASDRDIAGRLSSGRRDAAFDMVDCAVLPSLRVEKHATFHDFKELAAAQLGVPVERQRWWCWNVRMNRTLRPCRPVLAEEDNAAIGALGSSWQTGTVPGLLLYLEILETPCRAVCKGSDHALLFFKLYDPASESLSFLGSALVPRKSCISDLRALCAPLASLPPASELLFFEEVKIEPVMVEALATDLTLETADLRHGDIVVVQPAPTSHGTFRHRLAPDFYQHLKSRLVVAFQQAVPVQLESKPRLLELTVATTIGEARTQLASVIGVLTAQLRFLRRHDSLAAHRPFDDGETFLTLLAQHDGSVADTLMYEVLDGPDTHKSLSVDWLETPSSPLTMLALSLLLGDSVKDLLELLTTQLDTTAPGHQLRLLQIAGCCVSRVVPCDESIDSLDDSAWRFRAEPVPADQLRVAPGERLVHVAHVRRDAAAGSVVPFGEPFLLKLRAEEPLSSVKARAANLLGLDGAGFSSWRWGVVSSGSLELICADSDAVLPRLMMRQSHEGSAVSETYLAVEHEPATRTKRSRPRSDSHALHSVQNRQLRIYN